MNDTLSRRQSSHQPLLHERHTTSHMRERSLCPSPTPNDPAPSRVPFPHALKLPPAFHIPSGHMALYVRHMAGHRVTGHRAGPAYVTCVAHEFNFLHLREHARWFWVSLLSGGPLGGSGEFGLFYITPPQVTLRQSALCNARPANPCLLGMSYSHNELQDVVRAHAVLPSKSSMHARRDIPLVV